MNKKTANVIIYCRESRDDGFENYDRIETQRDILIGFCNRQGLGNIVEVIMDDNKSGTSFERLRPIEEKVRRKEVDILLCKDASRLGRNILESLNFAEFLANHNVELVFESERYDEDMFPLIAWFNERRAKDDSTKIRRVLRHKMEEGSMVIKAPYGYIKNGNSLRVDKNAAQVVREVFDLFLNGKSMGGIAGILNERGYPTPSQLKGLNETAIWNKQHVSRILKHRIYTGDMPYGMREKVSYKSKRYVRKPPEDWIVIPNHHEPIISKADFEAAQARQRPRPRKSNDSTFSGMLFCGRCASRMLRIERKNLRPSYVCAKSHREGRIKDAGLGCSPHRVFSDDLAAIVARYIERLLTEERFQDRLHRELRPSADDELTRQLCESRILELQKKASAVYDDKLSGVIPAYLFKQKLEAIDKDLLAYEQRLKRCARSLEESDGQAYTIESIVRQSDIGYDTVAMLFKKILVFAPNELTSGQSAEYGLSGEECERIKMNGGIVFVQNYIYRYHPADG